MSDALNYHEKRKQFFTTIELGQDVKTQTELIKRQTKDFVSAQLASSHEIVASQARVREITKSENRLF